MTPTREQEPSGYQPHSANPILPGYFADPCIIKHAGIYYIYATIDPWGGDTLACWSSGNFRDWTYHFLNWPTTAACLTPLATDAKVWAPAVIRGPDQRFYMYVSVGSQVWVGVASHPLGPWTNLLGDQPLIPGNFRPGYHMIDAEVFADDDGSFYLYWGSGLDWVNGRCWAVKLRSDLKSFDGEVRDVTPSRYFEGPFMVKRHGRYFLMNSTGKTIEDSYAVEYAVGDNPFGPFHAGANSPILAADAAKNILGPGQHVIFEHDGRDYILYHRHSIPFDPAFIGRQVCIDEIRFRPGGEIEKVVPTHDAPPFVRPRLAARRNLAANARINASSMRDSLTAPERAIDDNFATHWAPAASAGEAWLELDLGSINQITGQEIRPEFPWKPYHFRVESSCNGQAWITAADYTSSPVLGSPIIVEQRTLARYLRLIFPANTPSDSAVIIDWAVFGT